MGHSKFNVVSCLFVRVFFLFSFALLFGVLSLETFKVQFLFILEENDFFAFLDRWGFHLLYACFFCLKSMFK